MDIATLLGVIGTTGVILGSMLLAANLGTFWDLTSVIIVIGGSLFATAIRWPLDVFMNGLRASIKSLLSQVTDPTEILDQVISLAQTARKESILALEKVPVTDAFLARSVRYLVDGYPPDTIQEMIDMEIETLAQRHKNGRSILENLGESAPAFGMIGTVIGLIVIMANLDDPSAIGPGIAVALITTLYGALTANMFFIPIAAKLKYRSQEEATNMEIIREGINSISKGENPKIIRQKLEAYLSPKNRQEEK
ncbi:MAG: motility protein A [Oligoflexus sp.]